MNALVRYAYIRALLADKKGVTAIEYGVIAALIIAVCVTILATVGGQVNTVFGNISASLATAL